MLSVAAAVCHSRARAEHLFEIQGQLKDLEAAMGHTTVSP